MHGQITIIPTKLFFCLTGEDRVLTIKLFDVNDISAPKRTMTIGGSSLLPSSHHHPEPGFGFTIETMENGRTIAVKILKGDGQTETFLVSLRNISSVI